ncbi:protein fantom isoform X2 [Dunckerocampus dactyliophorus]|uniref:protein fantom isoform X2 n=1 Tax=Dunckerocampus dactyliophorus TaxID=161453 RepID=UPI0024059A55|nr:protein fantom isoform X2 [Dunckerocampus dactyliophorus]XP_054632623.1 protein fantom isoform X2 [Dunckerocampus dactyliophorus]
MSFLLEDTAAEEPVKYITNPLREHVRVRLDLSRVSRKELEDNFLQLHEDSLVLKQHIHQQEDKIKKLGTKLLRLVKDRRRMEQLASGVGPPVSGRLDAEKEDMMDEFQEKVRALEAENERLKQRLFVAKQQLLGSPSGARSPYGRVQSRITPGLRKQDDASSPLLTPPRRARSLAGDDRPPTGQATPYIQSLLEEAREKTRNLENVIESQLRRIAQLEEEKQVTFQQQNKSELRSQINNNVTMIKLQKQLSERSNAIVELQARFLQLQESQRTQKACYDAATAKVADLSSQLRDERLKSVELRTQLQSSQVSHAKLQQLQERLSEAEQEKELLKEQNEKLVNSMFDVSQQQKWSVQEQQLKQHIAQLETALQADLHDKNQILDKVKAERDTSEKLTEENQKLLVELAEQKQQLKELQRRVDVYSRTNEYDVAELTEALLLIKDRKSQRAGELSFLQEGQDGPSGGGIREHQDAHAETIQELEKVRQLLTMESQISSDLKAELDIVQRKVECDKSTYTQQLEHQTQMVAAKDAKIHKLQAQLRDVAYSTKSSVLKANIPDEDGTLHLEDGENLLELQIVGATLTPDALETLGDPAPSTFCTYAFYLFDLHATPVVTGPAPKYGFTSKYVVSVDDNFLDYLHRHTVSVELHQALGLKWRTVASTQLRLHRLLLQEGTVAGSLPLVGSSGKEGLFGSLDYSIKLRVPITESGHLYKDRLTEAGSHDGQSRLEPQTQSQVPPGNSSWNELDIIVRSCKKLQSRSFMQPSPYVVYKFFHFPDYPTSTMHDCCDPHFSDIKSYSVLMDACLDQYLRSEALHLYVFDYKEEQMDVYLGKAGIPLESLVQDKEISGEFDLYDFSGRHAGQVDVSLKWKSRYLAPPVLLQTTTMSTVLPVEKPAEEVRSSMKETKEHRGHFESSHSHSNTIASKEAALKSTKKILGKEAQAARRVTFLEDTRPVQQASSRTVLSPAVEEDEDEASVLSEGQLVPSSSQGTSELWDTNRDVLQDGEMAPGCRRNRSDSTQSDSDDGIVHRVASATKVLEGVRVEVMSLSLQAESRVSKDSSVVRLFVEYSFLDMPTEETPLSLPKPPPGKSVSFNYSKVIPVDADTNRPRRRLLRDVLRGKNPHMERIRFTVVSEPPEEEEQERECEDVGVAFLNIPDLLHKRGNVMETNLNVMEDGGELVGTLSVSFEGLETLRAIIEEPDAEKSLLSSLLR